MNRAWVRQALLGLLLGAVGWIGPVQAAEMVWKFRSENRDPVAIELYSQDRNKTWPGGGRPFVLESGRTEQFRIDCNEGELICYGAWARRDASTFWGAGMDGVESCRNCCARCGSKGLRTQVLKP